MARVVEDALDHVLLLINLELERLLLERSKVVLPLWVELPGWVEIVSRLFLIHLREYAQVHQIG